MTPTHTQSRAEHKAALASCRTCPACIQELVTLLEQCDAQSRSIGRLQLELANARGSREAIRHPLPGT